MNKLLEKLTVLHRLEAEELLTLLENRDAANQQLLAAEALKLRQQIYGNRVFIRGLIEFTNHCKCNCYYCGLRCSNSKVQRYRLTEDQILSACREGHALGLRSFVLQGGEDPFYDPDRVAALIGAIKSHFPDSALTLSLGEHSREAYALWFRVGADRYLLRHETADPDHYRRLHPPQQTLENRLRCLEELRSIGYQVGCGFMVGSPGQGSEQLVQDLMLLLALRPHMVGIGPFIPQKDTPLGNYPGGSVDQTLYLLSIVRLLLPQVLLPATTALGTLDPRGRERALLAGANVCMPNLSPQGVRKKYAIYDNKLSDGAEAVESLRSLEQRLNTVQCYMALERGDHIDFRR